MTPSLFRLQDPLEDIVVHSLEHDPPASPPCTLIPLMLTCRLFRNVLHPRNNARLYRRIFARKFDYAAFARRSPPPSFPLFPELKKRFQALHCIKQGDIHHPALQDAFLVAYIMVLEDDTLNHRYLQDAGLPALLHKYITGRLQSGHNVWPIEDACNTLAVALFWHMTSQDSLNGESDESRETVMAILLPLSFAWFRYSFVEQGFDPHALIDDMRSTPRLSPPAHAPVPPAPVTVSIEYMGHAFHLQLPAIALSASLAYFARLDAFPLMTTSDLPPTRAQTPPGRIALEDVVYYHRFFHTRVVPRGPGSPASLLQARLGSLHDWDWQRAVASEPAMSRHLQRYTPGILTGKWRGTLLVRPLRVPMLPHSAVTNVVLFTSPLLLRLSCDGDDDDDPPLSQAQYDRDPTPFMTGAGPAAMSDSSRHPFFCYLEEHVRYSEPESGLSGDAKDDTSNFPLLPQSRWSRKENGYEYGASTKAFYRTFNPECHDKSMIDHEVVDVILSGKAESHLQPAWGNCEFWGRVRVSDGLVVLVQHLLDFNGLRYGGRICTGYVLSSQNFVGKWKYCSPGTQWEGIWSLNKVE
ncbi:hypothetical protein EDB85DRAFT_2141354 [Lactarius pseudohatsudake]|nr:hypothetical protein EDB85DRAFT_2141354 [Lactarius pseudohatsudake]